MEVKESSLDIYRKKREVTIVGTVLNLLLTAGKYIVGYMVLSPALISDATHSASDYVGDLIVLLGIKLGEMPADDNHPYGHGKFETFASFAVGLLILSAGVFIFYDGLIKFLFVLEGEAFPLSDDYIYALYLALASVFIKEGLYRYTIYYARRFDSPILLANANHHRSDSYSSIGVLVGVIFTLYFPSLRFMDPLAAMVVSGFILHMSWEILSPAFHELVETSDVDAIAKIKVVSDNTLGVKYSKEIRTRTIRGNLLVDIKIEVEATFSLYRAYSIGEDVKRNIKSKMRKVIDVIVHLEPSEDTSLATLEKQSNIEQLVQSIIDTYDNTLEDIKDIRYYYINRGIDIILIFATKKELTSAEEASLGRTIKGLLTESYDYINRLYIGFQYKKKSYKYH